MIFVSLGTQDKTFERLLIKIEELIHKGIIQEEVIVQAGKTSYNSSLMTIFDFVSQEKVNEYIAACSLMICHAGVGTIMNAINHHKKVIAVARRAKYGEHENDHQVEITSKFTKMGLILGCMEVDELEDRFKDAANFQMKEYVSNQMNFCAMIEEMIEEA